MASEASVRHLNGATLTETGQAYTGQGVLRRVIGYSVNEGGASAAIYDAAAEGITDLLVIVGVDPTIGGGEAIKTNSMEIGRDFVNGISVVITGTGSFTLVFGDEK
jgi:hypothetical protein